ncbi:MAG: hypothetical protein ABSD50_08715 [Smithella sp.]|jgi:hypothetical protein
MKKIIVISILLLISSIANAEWISSDSINDPAKEKLCLSLISKEISKKAKAEPFEMDSHAIEMMRGHHPEQTFVVVHGSLYDCMLMDGTGKFDIASITNVEGWSWHRIEPPKPKQHEPSIETSEGRDIAWYLCKDAYRHKFENENMEYDHSFMDIISVGSFDEVFVPKNKRKGKGKTKHNFIAGKKVEKYDVVVQGKAFYGPANPDLTAVHFACLLSPMFEVKAIQYEW